jgi:hypothetical protein
MKEKNRGTSDEKNTTKKNIEHPDCGVTVRDRKVLLSKKTEKTYKVTVTYIQITDEEAKIKRAIIESILKKSYKK